MSISKIPESRFPETRILRKIGDSAKGLNFLLMKHIFGASNPGLRLRFPMLVHFPDYSADEFTQISQKTRNGGDASN